MASISHALFILVLALVCIRGVDAAQCIKGRYSANGQDGGVPTACTDCTLGYTTVGAGTVGTSNAVCTLCVAGYGSTNAGVTCNLCIAGSTYSPSEGTISCRSCDANHDSCTRTAPGTCKAGYYGTAATNTCTPCSIGTYKAAAGDHNTESAVCLACGNDYWTVGTGSSTHDHCIVCPHGTFSATGQGTSAETGCTPCGTGYSTAVRGVTGADTTACDLCTAGYGGYYTGGSSGLACMPCSAGLTWKADTQDKSIACRPCDYHADSCTVTDPGTCAAGYYGTAAVNSCKACRGGTYKALAGDEDTEANVCLDVGVNNCASNDNINCIGYTGTEKNKAGTFAVACASPTYADAADSTLCSSTVTWNPNDVEMTFGLSPLKNVTVIGPIDADTTYYSGWSVNVTSRSNGRIYQGANNDGDEVGHFRLKLYIDTADYGELSGTSECIRLGMPGDGATAILKETMVSGTDGINTYDFRLEDIVTVKTKKFFLETSSTDVTNSYVFTVDGKQPRSVNAYMMKRNCTLPQVVGQWDDPVRWDTGLVPALVDDVVIPANSGVIQLNGDVTVRSLTTNGGLINGGFTYCPSDWMMNPTTNPSTKCYKKFETPQSFDDAEVTCRTSSLGSMDSHLVQISDRKELGVVQRLCRGGIGTIVTRAGCWIGLSDPQGIGQYSWLQPETVRNNTFRDWRRYEYNNHTFSEGQPTNGELCVQMVPWQGDALISEQGSFNDIACKLEKPFVCQIFAKTQRYTVTVSGTTTLNGGGIKQGQISMMGTSHITDFYAWRGSNLLIKSSAQAGTDCTIHKLLLEDGSSFGVETNVTIETSGEAYIGEFRDLQDADSILQMQAYLFMEAGVTWNIVGSDYDVQLEARADIAADIVIASDINLNLNQGGLLSRASFTLTDTTTFFNLGGGSQMSTYDAYELKVQHRGPVIGEYQNAIATELMDPTTGIFEIQGVFRLKFTGGTPYDEQITSCIPYHATAEDLAIILSNLTMVQDRGGVTVRRYGEGEDPFFGYGYTFRIEMDAPPTPAFELGPLALEIDCYGIHNCGCAETKVPMKDQTGQRMCHRREGNSSRTDGDACVTPPIINVQQVTELSYTRTFGDGSLIIDTGVHRLPPKADVLISSASTGLGIVGADVIEWGGIAVDGVGTIIAAGTGWASWDSASVLFGPAWWDIRGYVNMLETAPAFNMYVDVFVLSGLGSILTASPGSNMTWSSGTWNGGTVGGRSTLNVLGQVVAGGTNKALRYGITMVVHETGEFIWSAGNISLANGASIIVEGVLNLQTVGERKYIGESHLLGSPDEGMRDMLGVEPAYQWHGYFGLEIPAELRGGTYKNPLCGDGCTRQNYMWLRGNASCVFAENSNTSFNMPLNLLGYSRMIIGPNAYVEMASGGICGNQVIVDISQGTIFAFSGGRMSMRATCKVQGEGDLLVAGGAHDMSFSIDSKITIAGGIMIWPFSRGPGATITFNGGLEIRLKGRLQIEPYSTNIVVYGEVLFKDECVLQFPMIGTAAQASNSDRPDAPDTTPRGTLTAVDLMTWDGGMLRGKADFISEGSLFISGGLKQIRSMAKLVNKGYAEWLSGDILMADNADFMNLGTVQMAQGNLYFDADNLYQGTVLPTENGGDVFALEFHSYDLDSGWLSYLDYVQLRTEFVSRAPIGWAESDQDLTILTPSNIV